MILQRVRYFLLLQLSHALLKLQSLVLAAHSKVYQQTNPTCLPLAEEDAEPPNHPLHLQHLLQPQLQQQLFQRRYPQSKHLLLAKLRRHPMLQHLSQKELELAFQVVDEAWGDAVDLEVQVRVPPSLQHLDANDWEYVTRLLLVLQSQQANSALH
jgi:hypothetical protein